MQRHIDTREKDSQNTKEMHVYLIIEELIRLKLENIEGKTEINVTLRCNSTAYEDRQTNY